MTPTGLGSFALAVAAAALFTTADAHGKMTTPTSRQMSEKFHKDSGALVNIGLEEMQIGPIEILSQHKQKDFPPSPTFNLLNGCRGTVYEEANEVTTIRAGSDFDVKWKIDAPHPGYMKLSILKPSEDSKGVITYKSYKTLLNIEPFGENGGTGGTTAKMPADVAGCEKPGDCVLQFFWYSAIAKQTYPTCADIVVSGSGGGTSTSTSTTTESSDGGSPTSSSDASTPSTPSTNSSPSTNSTPSTNTTPSSPSTDSSPSTNTSPSTSASPSTNTSPSTATVTKAPSTSTTDSNVAGEAETSKCARRMRRH
ncbi:Lytic polysaccharide mono-oxygenase [Phytophthora infestans]|uniref:Lytic polysaccharide mono-oxygenase n=1 Tax=Phytophthora infestans TaxID=4787 RepID=A0A833S1I1_PHYIN|nr:Lytic polysaccharide mono-oxygenase [Phytophthora infestans]KAF4134385.1 Lytic polysaccharide mono-oxygenase [Phytophthora infestans]